MPTNKVWKLEGWTWERPDKPEPYDDMRHGLPAVHFATSAGGTATLVFKRSGELRGLCLEGEDVSSSALRHMGIGQLEKAARRRVGEAVRAFDAGRREGVDPEVLRRQDEARALLAQTRHLRGKSPVADAQMEQAARGWALEDMIDGFRPPARPGRARGSDVDLASAAIAYVERCVNGPETVGAVARSLSLTPSGFSGRLQRARERGYLSGTPVRGQVEGAVLPAARRVIAKAGASARKGV